MEKATFGAGCFWGVEAAFRRVKGGKSTSVGYMGGWLKNPTYRDVCSGQTGHAEVVQVDFDPSEVSYDKLSLSPLNVFRAQLHEVALHEQLFNTEADSSKRLNSRVIPRPGPQPNGRWEAGPSTRNRPQKRVVRFSPITHD